MLLEQSLIRTDYEKLETKLIISEDFYNILVSNINQTANSIRDFFVVEHNNKMVVTFHYQNSKEKIDIKKAEDNCLKSYKTYPYDKMYLELINYKWTVVDVFIRP